MSLLRIDRFAKGVIFAALAALGAVFGTLASASTLGVHGALSAVFAGLTLAWLFGIAERASAGFKAVLVAGPLLALLLFVWPDPKTMALTCTALIAITRGVFLRPGPVARTVALEAAVGLGAYGLAAVFVPGGLGGLALAAWSYFLVQSLPLLTAASPAEKARVEPDAFAAAMTRAERILSR